MPQMSPLLWNSLFIMFSALLLVSMIKIYFISEKLIEKKNYQAKNMENQNNLWAW